MIFRPELAKLILQGKKTQTRRLIKDGEKACRYKPGHAYALQPGRGKRAVARITVHAVRSEIVGAITLKDAKREGFATRAEFFAYWDALHGPSARDREVWVISFAPGDTTDTLRLLAARPGAPHGDYVTEPRLAMGGSMDPGEAITGYEQTQVSHAASQRDDQLRRDRLRTARDLAEQSVRIMREEVDGPAYSRELKRTVRAIEHHVTVLDQQLGNEAA